MDVRERTIDVLKYELPLEVPGLSFRGFRGEADYPHMLAVINASKVADEIERSDSLEDVTRNYAHLHNCDPYQDMIFAEVDGEVIGYGRVWWDTNSDGEWLGIQLSFLDPAWRGKGIGTAMLHHNESRLREIAERLQEEGILLPSSPRLFEIWLSDTEVEKERMVLKEGYEPVRYAFSMVRPLNEPVEVTPMQEDLVRVPSKSLNGIQTLGPEPSEEFKRYPDLEIRPVPPEHYRTVWDASQEAFQDHWSFVPEPEEDYQNWLVWPGFDPTIWKVAWDGDQVAGMVLNFVDEKENVEYNRKRGYTESICVRRPWRRRGLARALLTLSLQMFKDMGMEEAALGVDSQNPSGALNLYESVGFRVVKRHTTYRKRF